MKVRTIELLSPAYYHMDSYDNTLERRHITMFPNVEIIHIVESDTIATWTAEALLPSIAMIERIVEMRHLFLKSSVEVHLFVRWFYTDFIQGIKRHFGAACRFKGDIGLCEFDDSSESQWLAHGNELTATISLSAYAAQRDALSVTEA
ncbi:hypothetical protein TWF281_001549 [Arthrobotrys megalospora]